MKRASHSTCVGVGKVLSRGICARGDDSSNRKTEFLGRARVHADGGSGDVALRRKYALPGACRAGWHANHLGLRDGATHAGEPLGCAQREKRRGNAHPDHSLPLGSHPGRTVFRPPLRGRQQISFLQFPL